MLTVFIVWACAVAARAFVIDDHLNEWITRYKLALEFMTRARADGALGLAEPAAAR